MKKKKADKPDAILRTPTRQVIVTPKTSAHVRWHLYDGMRSLMLCAAENTSIRADSLASQRDLTKEERRRKLDKIIEEAMLVIELAQLTKGYSELVED